MASAKYSPMVAVPSRERGEGDSDAGPSIQWTSYEDVGYAEDGEDEPVFCGGMSPSEPRPTACGRWVHSEGFKMLVAFVILANTIVLAVQVDSEEWEYWPIVNDTFLVCFVLEICLRLFVNGCAGFFCHNQEWAWNLFDFFIVFTGTVDSVFGSFVRADGEKQNKAILLARVLRALRVLRVLRVLRTLRKLRMLSQGLLESVVIVFWIGVLVLIMIFISSILTTTLIGQNQEDFPPEERGDIEKYFGTVGASMFTLFQFLTMDDWNSVDRLVVRRMPMMQLFFFPFIFFGGFVIMSLLTGVMADHMNDVRRSQDQADLRERLSNLENLAAAVAHQDVNGDGELDRAEFVSLFDPTSSFALDLEEADVRVTPEDAQELFDWFDVAGDGKITHRELRNGLVTIFEGLPPLQLYKLSATVRATEQFVYESIDAAVRGDRAPWSDGGRLHSSLAERRMSVAAHRMHHLDASLTAYETQTRELMRKCGWVKPPA